MHVRSVIYLNKNKRLTRTLQRLQVFTIRDEYVILNGLFLKKLCLTTCLSLEEVVLALLLEEFEFSLSDEPIIWRMTGIASPHTNRKSKIPRMPMIVKLAN